MKLLSIFIPFVYGHLAGSRWPQATKLLQQLFPSLCEAGLLCHQEGAELLQIRRREKRITYHVGARRGVKRGGERWGNGRYGGRKGRAGRGREEGKRRRVEEGEWRIKVVERVKDGDGVGWGGRGIA